MNIRPKIPIYLGGSNIWYQGLIDYDPNEYKYSYDTSRLVNGDIKRALSDPNFGWNPWKSNISGYDKGRYLPTTGYGAFGKEKAHYNYTLGVEGDDYYKKFGEDLIDALGNFTPAGEAWARAVDALLPSGSNASFYDPITKKLRTSWTTQYRDAHGRPAKTFTNLKDYVEHVRNDQILGARHNVFLNKGKRYFYIDNQGQKHWVDPSVVDKYNVSKDPAELGWEGTTYWDDYELTGLKDPQLNPEQEKQKEKINEILGKEKVDKESLWLKIGQGFNKIAPDLLDSLRLAGNMINNQRVYDESMKAILPNLQQSYHTYRQVTGDEATKLGYYRRAVQGEQRAARPFTSDADRQVAYMNEAKRIGDELRAQGDLADNQRIRETSAESSAHLDSNIERDTTVANSNLTEMLKADAAKHQLTALKHAADWTNLEQYLMGRLYKLEREKAKQEGIQDLIKSLQMQEDIANDPDIKSAYDALNVKAKELFPNGNVDWNDSRLSEAIKNLLSVRRKAMIKYYTLYAKSGTKITKKDNSDKFLYKTSRDIVEHFRKMSKMTDDSRVRTMPKPIKLPSHPKKFLYGGLAPFTIYRPLGVGGELTYQQSTESGNSSSSKSAKDDAAKNKLDMIKELFKQVLGLPIDVSKVYQEISGVLNKAKAFGEELSTDDLASMYLNVMNRMSLLKYSQESYKQAHALAVANEALNEIAVGSRGELILQNMETGEIKRGTYSEWVNSDKKLNPLTNSLLLEMRAKSPNLVFDDDIFNVVNNGVGLTKIAKEIKSLAASLGSSEKKLEGISEVQSNRIKAGLSVLAGFDGTPDGFYKITQNSKDSSANVKAALNYIYEMLPTNYKTILKMHSGSEENSLKLIAQYLTSQTSDFYKEDIAPLTGKASDKNKENDIDKLGINSATLLLLGMSSPRPFAFSIGNGNMFNGLARVSSITKDGNSVGADYAFSEIYKSDLHKNLDLDNACFGDVPINKALKDRIIVDNSTIAGVDLPYTTDKNGRIIPDFLLLNRIEEADLEILRAGINPETEPQRVNEIYAKHNLPIKYGADNRLTGNYKRFAVILATAIEDVFLNKSGLASNGTLSLVSDEDEINKYINEIKKTTGQKDIDMDRPGIFTGNKDIYKGSIFIPIIGDLVDAVSATGGLKAGNYDELRSKYLTRNYNEAPLFVKQ